ncbi:FAD-dependent oxidoreductase [Mesorhizobium sp. 113-3-3]|uniref:FAD-dependent oxidoreductase n=1 Tax=Mesorhizobium sp. 113-3-3 TaxID=2744516 RepID=UPI0019281C61|nr:NAD(P)/FAD-dependent oxidoreductase [Mesorhizobium sp. 113-3-3]BCG77102.1 FAD-dependent oxidoreductase [Mesorhizobium sp. 113-3-3]
MAVTTPSALSVAIIGAGVAGLALAVMLRRQGIGVCLFEARSREDLSEGVFLTLAPNGINALRALGLAERVSALGIRTLGFEIMNAAGHRLIHLDERQAMREAGAESITLRRSDLLGALLDEALALGADIRFGHAVTEIEDQPDCVRLAFGNGVAVDAAWLAGCDGVWSRVRRVCFPASPDPVYTGLTGVGGVVELPFVEPTGGLMRMVFGKKAFFGYMKPEDGPVLWFSSFPLDEDAALARPDPLHLAATVRQLHAGDPRTIRQIVETVTQIPRTYPVFDMLHLPKWHTRRVILLGDAAHAVSPHSGQGASMAVEDAVVLAACLDATPLPAQAFAAFQALRQDRVEHIVKVSRRIGSQKQVKGRVALFLRDLMLPFFIRFGSRTTRAMTRYRADLAPLEKPST